MRHTHSLSLFSNTARYLIALLFCVAVVSPAQAATISVTTTTDTPATGFCTLREAIANANAASDVSGGHCVAGTGTDTIVLPSSNNTFTLTTPDTTDTSNALPAITQTLTILGNGATLTRDTSNTTPRFRLFTVNTGATLTLNNLTLTNGAAPNGGMGPQPSGAHVGGNGDTGGAILNSGTLTLRNCTLSNNAAGDGGDGDFFDANGPGGGGGAITSSGTLLLINSTLSNNKSGGPGSGGYASGLSGAGDGGAIYNTGTLTVSATRFSNNTTQSATGSAYPGSGSGGAIYNVGALTVATSTFDGNTTANDGTNNGTGNGGAVFNDSTQSVSIRNSTFSANTTGTSNANKGNGLGGGLYSGGSGALTLTDNTFTGNTAGAPGTGGGVFLNDNPVTLSRNLIAGNIAPTAAGRELGVGGQTTLTTDNYNLFGFNNDAGISGFTPSGTDITPAGALNTILNITLANNGGPTQTHALVANSPALDAIPTTDASCDGSTTDQRGVQRPQGTGCDIGAFELGGSSATIKDKAGNPVTFSTNAGLIANAALIADPSGALSGYTYPNGFFSFDVTGLTPGGTATVTITLPVGSTPTAYLKCNATGTTCTPFSGAVINGNVVTLTLVDGGAGDSDGVADGTIKDPGGPGVSKPAGGGAMPLAALVALGLVGVFRRRRSRR